MFCIMYRSRYEGDIGPQSTASTSKWDFSTVVYSQRFIVFRQFPQSPPHAECLLMDRFCLASDFTTVYMKEQHTI